VSAVQVHKLCQLPGTLEATAQTKPENASPSSNQDTKGPKCGETQGQNALRK